MDINPTLIEMINKSEDIFVLTGAGMSTESGIPDFRSRKGIYAVEPEKWLSRKYFFNQPKNFYENLEKYLYHPHTKPNKGHEILAKWEQKGKIIQIVTQNIDGFHQLAGNEKVLDYHGTIKTATCYNPKCQRKYNLEELFKRREIKTNYWECDCGKSSTRRYIKPDIVLFGETGIHMNKKTNLELKKTAWNADLMLVLGTTLSVYPFNEIVEKRNKQIPTIIVNQGETKFDQDKNVVAIKESIGRVLTIFDTQV